MIKDFNYKSKAAIIAYVVVSVLVVGGLVFWAVSSVRKAEAAQAELELLTIDIAQQQLEREYADLNNEFAQFENSRQYIKDDSIKRQLNENYEKARLQVEKLQQELNNQKQKSAKEIAKLRGEIDTLRALLRHYVEEIDRLNKENEALRNENTEIKRQNNNLQSQVSETTRKNEVLSERMTIAERLNVTGLKLIALNRKGKPEKKVEKASQLAIIFTIPQNNSTPVGEKTIYVRIISPSGQLLSGGGNFAFEGGSVPCSAQKTIEYEGEEITDLTIYWDVNTPLIAGDYTVELFADNFRLTSKTINLK